MYKHILIPTDGTELSSRAVVHGCELAKAVGAAVSLLHITTPFRIFTTDPAQIEDTPGEHDRHARERATAVLGEAAEIAKRVGASYECLTESHNDPYEVILQLAYARRCDLVVMASHGRRGMSAFLLGSETNKVLAHSRIPVLVVR